MRHWQRASRLRRWLGILLAAVVCVSAVGPVATPRQPTDAAPSAVSTAVYLPDPTAPALDLAAVREQGVRVVADPTALVDVTARTTTGAILLDRATFDTLPAAWLAAQVRQGHLVVGFDVPADRFTRLAGLDRHLSTANMRLDWQGVPFYSWAYQRESAGQITNAGLNSDALYSTAVFLGRLRDKLDGAPVPGLGLPVPLPSARPGSGGMLAALGSFPRGEGRLVGSALALRVIPTSAAPVADLSPYGAALSHLYTHDASGINNGGQYEWRATAYARDGYSGDSGRIQLQGWNNSRGWHTTGADICYLTGGGTGGVRHRAHALRCRAARHPPRESIHRSLRDDGAFPLLGGRRGQLLHQRRWPTLLVRVLHALGELPLTVLAHAIPIPGTIPETQEGDAYSASSPSCGHCRCSVKASQDMCRHPGTATDGAGIQGVQETRGARRPCMWHRR